MNESVHPPVSRFRFSVVVIVIIAAFGILLWRAVDLHVFNKAFLQGQGDARSLRIEAVAAHRGMIMDRHGEALAISTPVDSVWVQPQTFLSSRQEWQQLARLLELDSKQMIKMVQARKQREFVYLKRRVNPELAQQVMKLNIPGVDLQREYRRYYPLGEVGAHVIGFTDVDDQGQEGLELAYDKWLQGHAGQQRVIKDRLGRVIKHVELLQAARPGKNLYLSLDRRLQYLTYRELKRAVFQHKARSGSAVILDTKTGEVMAIVNQPSYNPNNRDYLKGERYRNRAVTDTFEPGSSIKPFTIATALESGAFKPTTVIDTSPGILRVGRSEIRDIRNYGHIDLATVIQKSSNVGATKIALAMPAKRLWQMFRQVGFGETTGSGYPGEVSGVLKHANEWREIERATMAFGYGLAVTPLQLARAYTALANKGMLMPVSFVQGQQAGKGKRVLSQTTAQQLRAMLEKVVGDEGTGSKAQVAGYRVAGKTGTSKKAGTNGYADDRYISVFAGMAPASKPRLVMVVVINEPSAGDYYGGAVAAPVFSRVMAGALRILGISPDNMNQQSMHMAALGEAK